MTTLPAFALAFAIASQTVAIDPAVSPHPQSGELGGACYGNGTCNAGMYCVTSLALCAELEDRAAQTRAPLQTRHQADEASAIDVVANQVPLDDIAAAVPLAYFGNVVPFGAVLFPALVFDAELEWSQFAAYSKVAGAAALVPATTGLIGGGVVGLGAVAATFGVWAFSAPFASNLGLAAAFATFYGVVGAVAGAAAGVAIGLPVAALLYGYFAPTAALNAWGRAEQRFDAQHLSNVE